MQENIKTIIDAANLAEKLEIVGHSDDIIHIRELRNQIAHEYVNKNLDELFNDVLQYVPGLKVVIRNVVNFIDKNI